MATQATTVTAFKLLCAEVADAIAAGSWSTAMSKYAQAEAVNAALALESETVGERTRRRDSLTGLKLAISAASEAAGSRRDDESRFISTCTGYGT